MHLAVRELESDAREVSTANLFQALHYDNQMTSKRVRMFWGIFWYASRGTYTGVYAENRAISVMFCWEVITVGLAVSRSIADPHDVFSENRSSHSVSSIWMRAVWLTRSLEYRDLPTINGGVDLLPCEQHEHRVPQCIRRRQQQRRNGLALVVL